MSIKLPDSLPAGKILRNEGIEVLGPESPPRPGARPLRIALLNLMPEKADAEVQIARLLGAAPYAVEVTLFLPDSHTPKTAPAAHIAAFYERWSAIRQREFDALIVTGAPVETLPFEEVTYWRELTEIFDWARVHVCRSFYICWSAQAALYHFHGVPKHGLDQKMFGVFRHRVADTGAALLSGFGEAFPVPVSRHTEVRAADLPANVGLEVLADSDQAGLCLIEDRPRGAVYMFNHLEYDAGTLRDEYLRDLEAGAPVPVPRHYFPGDDPARPPIDGWRPYGHLLFRNWIAEIGRCAHADGANDEPVRWLLAERRGPALVGQAFSDFLISGNRSPDSLAEVLRGLAEFGLSPRAVKVHRHGDAQAAIELRSDAVPEARAQRIARAFLDVEGIRRVAYRTTEGAGGLLVKPVAPPLGPAQLLERPAAA
jgi:homoserine O-succinyltransferase